MSEPAAPGFRYQLGTILIFTLGVAVGLTMSRWMEPTVQPTKGPYKIRVGDVLTVDSLVDKSIDRRVLVSPDGSISLPHVGIVPAHGQTLEALQLSLEKAYKNYYRRPAITVSYQGRE